MADRRTLIAQMAHRDDWLAQVTEEVIDPAREIIDPHHHLWNRGGSAYEVPEWWADTGSGHNVTQTVFIECHAYYDDTAPDHLRPVGETRKIAELAQASTTDPDKASITAIVAHADLRLDALDQVLDAHDAAGNGLFRGIRHAGAHEPMPEALFIPGRAPAGLYADPDFRRGVARLGERGLTYDTWHYHHQNRDFLALAKAVPGTTMILDHFGTPLGVGQYEGQRETIFERWQDDVAEIAECPNVIAKLGGMAMPDNGFGWHDQDRPPTSDEFVEAQAPWYLHMIQCFGPERCMFESNFPVDKVSISYRVLWNGLKKIAAEFDETAQQAMFSGTARSVYRLG
ncbi:MAG: amidohydrolase family protein [Pseudomonadota bacterium]